MHRALTETAHRPWPLPTGPWIMSQSWHDLLFAHWPIDAAHLRPLIPAALEIDKFQGDAWIGVVPFRMSGVRLRATPAYTHALRISRTQRPHLRHSRRQTRRLVFLPRRRQRHRRQRRPRLVPSPLFQRPHALRKSQQLDRIRQRTHPSQRRKSKTPHALPPHRRNLPSSTRHARTFPDRALLPLRRRMPKAKSRAAKSSTPPGRYNQPKPNSTKTQ